MKDDYDQEILRQLGVQSYLNSDQVAWCKRRAIARKQESRRSKRKVDLSVERDEVQEWMHEFDGMYAELAAQECYPGLYGAGSLNTFHNPDLNGPYSDGYDVRSTRGHRGHLILRDDGKEKVFADRVYILVTGIVPYLYVRGWIYGHEALEVGKARNPGGKRWCLYVELPFLHSPRAVPPSVATRGHHWQVALSAS